MTDHKHDDADEPDEPWGDGPEHPPLTDVEDPLADEDDEDRGWMPPVP